MLWSALNVSERQWSLSPRFSVTHRSPSSATKRRSRACAACSCAAIATCSPSTTRAAGKPRAMGPARRPPKDAEKPKACLRRELVEELGCRVPCLVRLGDWLHRRRATSRLRLRDRRADRDVRQRRASRHRLVHYEEIAELAVAHKLRTGLRARRDHRVSAPARRPSLTAIVPRRRLPPHMESHVQNLPNAERAVRISHSCVATAVRSLPPNCAYAFRPTSIYTGGSMS